MIYLDKMSQYLKGYTAQADNLMQMCMISIGIIICKLSLAREARSMIIKLKIIIRETNFKIIKIIEIVFVHQLF